MVITLAEDLDDEAPIELDAVDTSGFRFVSFHGRTDGSSSLQFRFSTQAGKFSDDIPRTSSFSCSFSENTGTVLQLRS